MRILVLGATGHLGQAIVRHALQRGFRVTAATRQSDPLALRGLTVETARLDQHLNLLPACAAGHDVLADAAAPYPLQPSIPGSLDWSAAVGDALRHAEHVVHAARSAGARLVFISSFTTLPRSESSLAALQSQWRRSTYPYFAAKQAMEQCVLHAAAQGLPAVIINPAACLGPWEFRSESSSFVRLVLNRRLPLVMDQVLSVIDVRDVAEIIGSALQREMFGRPIPVAGHNTHLAELARQILAIDGGNDPAPLLIDPQMASFAALSASAAWAAIRQPVPDLWRAVPLIADAFPMLPSPDQVAIGLSLRPLLSTLHASVAFHRGWPGC